MKFSTLGGDFDFIYNSRNNWSKEVFPKMEQFFLYISNHWAIWIYLKRLGRRVYYINILCIRPISCAEEGGKKADVKKKGNTST